ncbi:hypothetical protein LJ753_01275 [Arthrobacter sp. zg-Y20]|uniref:hypothetical protein n=1 Tax=unclassified Arthrobacter TaxID=235627 RepID=UPI001D157035|nr:MULTISPECIES: hypothetical protein [unclassified Arthrobacter]MCC3274500.1 hypothetical protein [Arthrobacter sp. zg-Y20]MDK1314657.1 hypothetical protein [Arthrobacter sp. zg.Y20]WIB07638.1 hypothetical protein QNO06_08025 [Arthrobacter sp. zg-Y20]
MTSQTEPSAALDPPPDVVAALIEKVASTPWPEDPEQCGLYLARLDCTADAALPFREEDLPGEERGWLHFPGGERGVWSAVDGKLESLGFFFYPGRLGSRALCEFGFEALHSRLKAAYGPPIDEGAYPNGHRSGVWHAGETSIELYAHVELAPVLQLGLGNRERIRVHEEARRHRA